MYRLITLPTDIGTLYRFTLTTDIGTEEMNTKSYLGMTCHYVLNNKFKIVVIGVSAF